MRLDINNNIWFIDVDEKLTNNQKRGISNFTRMDYNLEPTKYEFFLTPEEEFSIFSRIS